MLITESYRVYIHIMTCSQALHISATKCIDHCRSAEAKYALVSATKCSCGTAIADTFSVASPGSPIKSMGDCARSTTNQMIGDASKATVAFYNLGYEDVIANSTMEVRKGHKVGPTTCLVGYELNSVMFGMDKLLMQADRFSVPKVRGYGKITATS